MMEKRIKELEDALREAVQTLRLAEEAINEEQNASIRGRLGDGGRANWKRACDRIFCELDGRVDDFAAVLEG